MSYFELCTCTYRPLLGNQKDNHGNYVFRSVVIFVEYWWWYFLYCFTGGENATVKVATPSHRSDTGAASNIQPNAANIYDTQEEEQSGGSDTLYDISGSSEQQTAEQNQLHLSHHVSELSAAELLHLHRCGCDSE